METDIPMGLRVPTNPQYVEELSVFLNYYYLDIIKHLSEEVLSRFMTLYCEILTALFPLFSILKREEIMFVVGKS